MEPFSRMTADDLGAVYEFLHSLPAENGFMGEVTFKKSS